MKKKELRQKNEEELLEIYNQLKTAKRTRLVRKTIARILTYLRQRGKIV